MEHTIEKKNNINMKNYVHIVWGKVLMKNFTEFIWNNKHP